MACVVCKGPVDIEVVMGDFAEVFAQADALGMESLTENQQVLVEGSCCSDECFDKLD